MSHFFTDSQYAALTALCDTLIPSLDPPPGADDVTAAYFCRAAADLDIARHLTLAIRDYATPESQAQTKQLLDLLSSPAGTFALTGRLHKFADLPFETREKILLNWSVSPIGLLRQAFQGIKRLAHSIFFSLTDENGLNPNWAAIQYPGPPSHSPRPNLSTIQPRAINTEAIDCDVVIVGSGAGGGVVAGVLAQAGTHVVVLEKGGPYTEADFHQREYDAFATLYENAGILTTEDLGLVVLAGSTLGGGTTINWSASFRTPDYVLEEWEREHHLVGFTGSEFQSALDAICAREHVSTDESHFNPQNQALYDGCLKLGYHAARIPRNVQGCGSPPACGWCCFGCPSGAKQSTLRTWLSDAAQSGAEIIANCRVEKVLIENGRAVGVAASVGTGENAKPVTVRAKMVVVSAGALHSPAILIRSGIQNPNIGLNLRLHPVTAIHGIMPQLSEPWRGVMMAAYSDELGNLDGNHYGVKIETPPTHPGLMGFGTPWNSAREFKTEMLHAAQQAFFIVLCRDRGSGQITVDKSGRPRIHYQLAPVDTLHLLKGVEAGLRIAVAAGAQEVGTAHSGLRPFQVAGDSTQLESYIQKVQRAGLVVNKVGLFSAHQMGTCRMGGDRAHSVLMHTGESWDVRNLYVADASTFPTASGVNPMITIQAIAYHIAQQIRARL